MTKREVNGARLEVVERGHGDPLVFVHGSASDYRTWQLQTDGFSDEFKTIAYSRRYHWPNEPILDGADYSMQEHVDDLVALLHSFDGGPVHLVGHSYGAFVALLAAMHEPRNVRTLVLAEPPVITLFVSNEPKPSEILGLLIRRPRTAVALMKFGGKIGPVAAAAERGDMETAMQISGSSVLGAEFYDRLPPARREQVEANSFKEEFLGSGFPRLHDQDLRASQVPTLLVGGQHSPALFHRLRGRLAELLPNAETVVIPEASHIMHEDNPAAYDAAVRRFLTEQRLDPST